MIGKFSKSRIATLLALFFHAVGLTGILVFESDFIINATAYNLLVSFALLLWTQQHKNFAFYSIVTAIVLLGFLFEIIGVNTGLIFGDYHYGDVLGYKWKAVPFIIGINWFIIIYCCGISTHTLLMRITGYLAPSGAGPSKYLKTISLITDGATIATIFDWLMEPVAVKLGFWQWGGDGSIPWYNYFCWFIASMLLLGIFQMAKFKKRNKFAVNLLLIQFMFFMILRTFLNN